MPADPIAQNSSASDNPPDTPATRQAAIDTALANAEKARADAEKARADAEKAAADARSAKAKADGDERNAAQAGSALGRQKRDAVARQKIAEAEKAAAAAQADQMAALIPDLGDVERGKLDTEKAEIPLFAGAVAGRALDYAAGKLVEALSKPLGEPARVLVTSDAELAASHAAYLDVLNGLEQLNAAARGLLGDLEPPEVGAEPPEDAAAKQELAALPLVQAAVAALPGALSLLSAHRAIATSAATVDDLAAAAATAGRLREDKPAITIVHDNVRLLSNGVVHARLTTLSEHRQKLVGSKLSFGDLKSRKSEELSVAQGRVKDVEAVLERDPADQAAKNALPDRRAEAAGLEREVAEAAIRIGLIDGTIAAIDKFLTSLTTVPKGGTRSPLTLAALREDLRDGKDPFTHVLLVKGNGGSTSQVIDDKPLWAADRFAVVGTAGITYMLIDTATSNVLAAGNASGAADVSGKVTTEFADVKFKQFKLE